MTRIKTRICVPRPNGTRSAPRVSVVDRPRRAPITAAGSSVGGGDAGCAGELHELGLPSRAPVPVSGSPPRKRGCIAPAGSHGVVPVRREPHKSPRPVDRSADHRVGGRRPCLRPKVEGVCCPQRSPGARAPPSISAPGGRHVRPERRRPKAARERQRVRRRRPAWRRGRCVCQPGSPKLASPFGDQPASLSWRGLWRAVGLGLLECLAVKGDGVPYTISLLLPGSDDPARSPPRPRRSALLEQDVVGSPSLLWCFSLAATSMLGERRARVVAVEPRTACSASSMRRRRAAARAFPASCSRIAARSWPSSA